MQELKLGRDGERTVGQHLERLRADGADVFHDVPGDGFNVDHVILSAHGFYSVETKAWSKSKRGEARVTVTNITQAKDVARAARVASELESADRAKKARKSK